MCASPSETTAIKSAMTFPRFWLLFHRRNTEVLGPDNTGKRKGGKKDRKWKNSGRTVKERKRTGQEGISISFLIL